MWAETNRTFRNNSASGLARIRRAALILAVFFVAAGVAAPAWAAFSSASSVTSSLNPSTAVDNVTFTATARSTAYDVRVSLGFGASSNQALFVRYDIANGTFPTTVTASQLTDATTAGNLPSIVVGQAGLVGDSYVIFNITAGATGVPPTDLISFILPSITATSASVTPSVTYSLHGSAASAAGAVPNNSALLITVGPTAITTYTTAVVPTGTFLFRLDGLAIAGCAAVPLVTASAQCSLVIGSGGPKVVTALYSGDGNYAGSTATLAGNQFVNLAVTTAAVTPGVYLSPYTFNFAVAGAAGTPVFTISAGGIPNGLTLSPAGVLSGTPTATGTALFVVLVTDAGGVTGFRQFTQNILPANQTISFSLQAGAKAATQIALNGTTTSGLPITYTSTTPLTCVLSGASNLRLLFPGPCSVTASQFGSPQYNAATPVIAGLSVLQAAGAHEIRVRSAAPQLQTGRLVNGAIVFTADVDPGPGNRLLGSFDIDGNNTSDLLYQNTTQGALGDVHTWRDFLQVNDQILRGVKLVWDVQALGDIDGDGLGDIVWRYTTPGTPDTGVSYVWFTNGSGVAEVRKRGGAPLDWTLLGARDLNNDGAADMVYISPTSQIRVLMATAARSCANFAAGAIPAGFAALHLADYTGNRRGDILIRNATTGEVRLVALDASGVTLPPSTANPNDANASCTTTAATIANAPVVLPTVPTNWTYYASVDFNGDGIADIVWLLPDGSLTLWMMNSFGAPPTVTSNAGTAPVGFSVLTP
ncbi:MAG: Ig-like domain repeat protein [Betaproteobacteria bacterium]|nr:Ig-like domain repeat protein [Betaproteobacteria bacterium]